MRLWPCSRKPSLPAISSSTTAERTSSSENPSPNRRTNGPIAHEALLSLALLNSSALRPSKSRRLTSLPSVAPRISPRLLTTSTTSGSGLFQLESDRTPIFAPQPTLASGAVLVKISASGPIATSRYCDHRPSSISASLSRAAASLPGTTERIAPPMRCSSFSRISPASRKSPRARSSMTRSIAEMAKVTPAALTACRSTGARMRPVGRRSSSSMPNRRSPGTLAGSGRSIRSAIVGAERDTSSIAPPRITTGVGPSSRSSRPARTALLMSAGSMCAVAAIMSERVRFKWGDCVSATIRCLRALVSSSYRLLKKTILEGLPMSSRFRASLFACAAALTLSAPAAAPAAGPARPWTNRALSADERAALVVQQLTQDEKMSLVFGWFATDADWKNNFKAPAGSRIGSAGYVPGIARLGIPPQWQTDAGVGVATQGAAPSKRERTALPSGIATAATWNPDLAFQGGRMIGSEARSSGFNVMLAGGVNLLRDPRNGRNFEYGGEDPLLAGTIVGSEIAGIQSNHIISTAKHYAVNDLETGRMGHDAQIYPAAARVSDLLAFQLEIERGDPGSVMCSYNRVNGTYACENKWLLSDVLRGAFGFRGFVMSDWGATHSTVPAALAGLDQESGWPFDDAAFYGPALKAAVASGQVPQARLDEMATRILRSMFAVGVVDDPVPASAPIDYAAHEAVSQADEEQAIVLLKNDGNLLPLANVRSVAIIGGHADKGVLSGSGSSLVYPRGGNAVPGLQPTAWPGPVMYYPSSPIDELRRLMPNAKISFADGSDPAAAAAAARAADVAIVFGTQWSGEGFDVAMKLDGNQDAVIDAVTQENPRTAVVLETNAGVAMPWAARVPAIVEAWYPGRAGGKAIANVLTGRVNPSGHLPTTFAASEDQLPRPVKPGGTTEKEQFPLPYTEGATVGYKWFDAKNLQPLFPFGHGLSYTRFELGQPAVSANADGTVTVQFPVRNVGQRRGMEVAQVYASPAAGGWEAPKRLAAFQKVDLAPGASKIVSVTIDPRLLATFDNGSQQWRIAPGDYRIIVGESARDLGGSATVSLPGLTIPSNWRPGPAAAAPAPQRGERGR